MGEAKKRRACPAEKRDISSAECGENRHSRYACPETCEHNPFSLAAYSQLLDTEGRLDLTTVKRLGAEDETAREAILAAARVDPVLRMNAVSIWQIFFRRDERGRSFAERWEQSGFGGLRNDERVLFRGKMKMRVALIEVHRVIDAERLEIVDLLQADGAPFTIVDRRLAARAPRFFTALGWIYPLPHFWRMSGSAIDLGDLGPGTGSSIIEAFVSHLGGPGDPAARQRWLAENFVRVTDAMVATGKERHRLMFAGIDGTWGAATYALQVPLAQALRRLRKESAVAAEEVSAQERAQGFSEAFVWLDERPGARTWNIAGKSGSVLLGRVLVGPTEWRLEAMGRARLEDFRSRFEAHMKKAVAFSRERVDDLARRMTPSAPTPNVALVPPQLLEHPNRLILSNASVAPPPPGVPIAIHVASLQREYLRTWRDQPVPALDGRTPRQAARDPAMRPRVIELVKNQVRRIDEENLQAGRNDDANELIRDLGLTEIDFPPPPVREAPPEEEDFELEDDESDAAFADDESAGDRPPAPRLSDPPLTFEVARERVKAALGLFDTADDALAELASSGSAIVEDLADMTGHMFKPGEFDLMVISLMQAWFALVPVGARAPELDLDAIADEIDGLNERLKKGGDIAADTFMKLSQTGRQPDLLTVLMGQMMYSVDHMAEALRPSSAGTISALVVLKAVIDELDRALRRR